MQRGRPPRGAAAKKQLEAVLKTEKEKAIKKYKLKYDKYLIVKPATNSPFDTLIAATQVVTCYLHTGSSISSLILVGLTLILAVLQSARLCFGRWGFGPFGRNV